MKRVSWLTGVVVLQAALLVALGCRLWLGSPPPAQPPAQPAAQPAASAAAGASDGKADGGSGAPDTATPSIRLAPAVQAASGIRVEPLAAGRAPAGTPVWGEVLAGTALGEAHLRLLQAEAEVAQWEPQLAHAQQEWQRLDTLAHGPGSVAGRQVDQARAERDLLVQRLGAAQAARLAVQQALAQEWGSDLVGQLVRSDGGSLAPVLAGQARLLLVADGGFGRGLVQAVGTPGRPQACQRLAAAPRSVAGSPAAAWFWLAPAGALRSGQRVQVTPFGGSASGVLVPEAAVVWHAGVPWIYVVTADGRFVRRALGAADNGAPQQGAADHGARQQGAADHGARQQSAADNGARQPGGSSRDAGLADPLRPAALELPGGGWLDQSLVPGVRVVVEGAQLLLSEESRAQIRNENGD